MTALVVRTEVWKGATGTVVKAVVRKADGTLIGVTNQTDSVTLVGKR